MDIQDLLSGINQAILSEYRAVMAYQIYSASLTGNYRAALRELFQEEAEEEFGHAQFFIDRFTAMGGALDLSFKVNGMWSVIPQPGIDFDYGDVEFMINQLMKMEIETVRLYTALIKVADSMDEHSLAVGIENILVDERNHRDELSMLVQNIV